MVYFRDIQPTKHGAYDFAVIESHRQIWKLRNESPYNKMVDYLKVSTNSLFMQ